MKIRLKNTSCLQLVCKTPFKKKNDKGRKTLYPLSLLVLYSAPRRIRTPDKPGTGNQSRLLQRHSHRSEATFYVKNNIKLFQVVCTLLAGSLERAFAYKDGEINQTAFILIQPDLRIRIHRLPQT